MIWALLYFQNCLASLNRTGLDEVEGLIRVRIGDDDRGDRAVTCIDDRLCVKRADQVALLELIAVLDGDFKRCAAQLYGVDAHVDEQLDAAVQYQTNRMLGAKYRADRQSAGA